MRRKNVASNPADTAASTEAALLLGGRLRQARVKRGISLRALARELGVSPSFVSQLENGKNRPSVATLYSMAQLLDVSIDQLFDLAAGPSGPAPSSAAIVPATAEAPDGLPMPPGEPARISRSELGSPANAWSREAPKRLSVTHPGKRPRLVMDSGVIWEQLVSTANDMDFIEIIYPAGSSSTNDGRMMRHAGFEYGWLLDGELEVIVGFDSFVLRAGDAIGFDSATPHLFRNHGTVDARGVWCVGHAH
jgi:transcriptional regulator with XRE-family HTH domain